MNRTKNILTALLGLIVSAIAVQAANTKITYLPFPITAPGTYVLAGNLTSSETGNVAAITISTAIPGPVILDLKGFTITGNAGLSVGIGVGSFAGTNGSSSYPITIRNGTLNNFAFGVWTTVTDPGAVISDITINHLTINLGNSQGNGTGISFGQAVSSTISNCSFSGGSFGIKDTGSSGNRYINCTFTNTNPLEIFSQNGGVPSVLIHCQFDGPPND